MNLYEIHTQKGFAYVVALDLLGAVHTANAKLPLAQGQAVLSVEQLNDSETPLLIEEAAVLFRSGSEEQRRMVHKWNQVLGSPKERSSLFSPASVDALRDDEEHMFSPDGVPVIGSEELVKMSEKAVGLPKK